LARLGLTVVFVVGGSIVFDLYFRFGLLAISDDICGASDEYAFAAELVVLDFGLGVGLAMIGGTMAGMRSMSSASAAVFSAFLVFCLFATLLVLLD
jgi:hypothetical protein